MRLSVDDGCASDLRIAELCSKYGIECVFYWPVEWHSLAYYKGYKPLHYKDARRIADRFEIGSHTVTHRHLTDLEPDDWGREIKESKDILEDMFGKKITKFCPPRGYTNEAITEYTLRIYESQRLTKQKGLVHIHPNSGANDNKPWLECITEEIEELFCHSHELDRYNLWEELEGYLERNRTTT